MGTGVPWGLGDRQTGAVRLGPLGGEEGVQGWGRTNWSLQSPESQK